MSPLHVTRPEFVYYRVYHENGAIATRGPAYLDDIYIGRIRTEWVTPPHTAGSLKHCLCSVENIDPKLTKLFASVSNPSALADDVSISLKGNQTVGIIPEDPVILFSKAMPQAVMWAAQPGMERFRVAPDSQSPVPPRFLFYGVYTEDGAQASRDPIDAEQPWVSKIDLNSILYPGSVTSLLHNLNMKEGIYTSQLIAQDGGPIGDDQIFTEDGNWLGASAEDHLVLKLASLPPFAEGPQYKFQNRGTGLSLMFWPGYSHVYLAANEQGVDPWGHFTLGLQDDGSVAFHNVQVGQWIGPNGDTSSTRHGFRLIPSTTKKDFFFICDGDPASRKAFYDAKVDSSLHDLELRELITTDSRYMWSLIPV